MMTILQGHVLDRLRGLPAESVHCVVTSPPYYGLRDYKIPPQVWGGDGSCGDGRHEWGVAKPDRINKQRERPDMPNPPASWGVRDACMSSIGGGAFCLRCGAWRGSLGLEPTVDLYLEHMVEICREIRRVLRRDGTFWLNIGDSYGSRPDGSHGGWNGDYGTHKGIASRYANDGAGAKPKLGLKPKDLMLIPARLALALQADGWWIRSEIVWAKRAPMPESVTDRPTCAHEKVWLLTKSARYYYDAEAVKEEQAPETADRYAAGYNASWKRAQLASVTDDRTEGFRGQPTSGRRNLRNVWLLGPSPFPEAHFATFSPEIPRRAILAGTSAKGCCPKCGAGWVRVVETRQDSLQATNNTTKHSAVHGWDNAKWPRTRRVDQTLGWRPSCSCNAGSPVPATCLDPFAGSGTTLLVADRLGRDCIGIELSGEYVEMARRRLAEDAGMFAAVAAE